MTDRSQDYYDKAFKRVKDALENPKQHFPVVRKWETPQEEDSAKAMFQEEVETTLALMAGDDKTTFRDDLESRVQTGSPEHGIKSMSTTMVAHNARISLFYTCLSGLLLTDAPPVAVSVRDSFSTMRNGNDEITLRLCFKPFGGEIEDVQKELAEIQDIPLNEKVTISLHEDGLQERIARAKKAYEYLADHYEKHPFRSNSDGNFSKHSVNEVNVNGRLEHIAAMVVDMKRDDISRYSSWKECAAKSPHFREAMTEALEQLPVVREALKRHGIDYEPTIVIYQPEAGRTKNMWLHFAPTKENIQNFAEGIPLLEMSKTVRALAAGESPVVAVKGVQPQGSVVKTNGSKLVEM